MKQIYTPEEANAILEQALAGKPLPGDMTRDQLVQLAAEVGINPEELDAAERRLHAQDSPDLEQLRDEYLEYRNRVQRIGLAAGVWVFIIFGFRLTESISPGGGSPGMMLLVMAAMFFCAVIAKMRSPVREPSFRRWLHRRERLGLRRDRLLR